MRVGGLYGEGIVLISRSLMNGKMGVVLCSIVLDPSTGRNFGNGKNQAMYK